MYKTKDCDKSFTHFVAESQHQDFLHMLSGAPFCSCLMDGSTDAGNVEDELIVILYFFKEDVAREVRLCVWYFALEEPMKADADGC